MNYDTETKPDVARTQAEKAIDAGAHVLVGAFDSGQTIAIAQVAEQRGVPLIVNIAAAPPITELGYKFVVRNFPTAPMLIGGAFDLHKEIFKASGATPKTAVLLSINDTFGNSDDRRHQGDVPQARHALRAGRHHHLRRRRQGSVGRGGQGQGDQGRAC